MDLFSRTSANRLRRSLGLAGCTSQAHQKIVRQGRRRQISIYRRMYVSRIYAYIRCILAVATVKRLCHFSANTNAEFLCE